MARFNKTKKNFKYTGVSSDVTTNFIFLAAKAFFISKKTEPTIENDLRGMGINFHDITKKRLLSSKIEVSFAKIIYSYQTEANITKIRHVYVTIKIISIKCKRPPIYLGYY